MMINPMSPQRAAILGVLQKAGRPLRLFEIAAATGMKPHNVCMTLLRMREDCQALQPDYGLWSAVAPRQLLTTAHLLPNT
jgi:hypothetical protein